MFHYYKNFSKLIQCTRQQLTSRFDRYKEPWYALTKQTTTYIFYINIKDHIIRKFFVFIVSSYVTSTNGCSVVPETVSLVECVEMWNKWWWFFSFLLPFPYFSQITTTAKQQNCQSNRIFRLNLIVMSHSLLSQVLVLVGYVAWLRMKLSKNFSNDDIFICVTLGFCFKWEMHVIIFCLAFLFFSFFAIKWK